MPLRRSLWTDTVAHLNPEDPVVVDPQDSLRRVIERMRAARSGAACVCRAGRLVGIFTERNLLKRVIGPRASVDEPVERYMTADPAVTRMEETIGSVMQKLRAGGFRHLPVVGPRGEPVGRISVRNVLEYIVDHVPKAVYNLPPHPDQVQVAREGA